MYQLWIKSTNMVFNVNVTFWNLQLPKDHYSLWGINPMQGEIKWDRTAEGKDYCYSVCGECTDLFPIDCKQVETVPRYECTMCKLRITARESQDPENPEYCNDHCIFYRGLYNELSDDFDYCPQCQAEDHYIDWLATDKGYYESSI